MKLRSPDPKEASDLFREGTKKVVEDEKEVNMKNMKNKPRLAEVLGVEVGERFGIKDFYDSEIVFYLDEDGVMRWISDKETSDAAIYIAINHPERIIRAPRLTEAELAICKAVGAKWVSKNKCGARRVTLWDAKPIFDEGMFYITEDDEHSVTIGVIGRISDVLFPSVHPGDCICAEEGNDG